MSYTSVLAIHLLTAGRKSGGLCATRIVDVARDRRFFATGSPGSPRTSTTPCFFLAAIWLAAMLGYWPLPVWLICKIHSRGALHPDRRRGTALWWLPQKEEVVLRCSAGPVRVRGGRRLPEDAPAADLGRGYLIRQLVSLSGPPAAGRNPRPAIGNGGSGRGSDAVLRHVIEPVGQAILFLSRSYWALEPHPELC